MLGDFTWVDSFEGGTILILLVVAAALGSQWTIRRRLGKETLQSFHEVGGYYMSAVGTLYAVILGLVVVDTSNKFSEARANVVSEANALTEVYALAEKMPDGQGQAIKSAIRLYIDIAVKDGWSHMQNEERDPAEALAYREVLNATRNVEPETENQKALYPALIDSFKAATESRRGRLNFEQYNIPKVEWFSLVIGGIITIAFTLFFAIDNQLAQSLMTGMVAFMLSLNLYIAFLFNSPYSGDLQVSREPFLHLQRFIQAYP